MKYYTCILTNKSTEHPMIDIISGFIFDRDSIKESL